MKVLVNTTARQQIKSLQDQIQQEANQLKGRVLTWRHPYPACGSKARPYVGRTCEIKDVFVDDDGEIKVRVKTHTLDGQGFLESNDAFHRVYRSLDAFEPMETFLKD